MAYPVMDVNRAYKKCSKEELYELYVKKNYSMDLVSEVTQIPLVILSRLFQDLNLPEEKMEYYDGKIRNEVITRPPEQRPKEEIRNLEDEFLSEF